MVVVENGGISAAQLALGLDKSTISRRLKDLESRIGQVLCARGRAGFSLTDAGNAVYLHAKQLLIAIEDFSNNCEALKNTISGSIEIAMTDSMTTDPTFPLLQAVRNFLTKYQSVNLTLSTIQTAYIEAEIASGRIHAGILPERQHNHEMLEYYYLYDELSNLYCGYNSNLYNKPSMSEDDIASENFVNMSYPEWMHLRRLFGEKWKPYPLPTVARSVEAAALMILSGRFVGFLPRHIGKLWVADGRLKPVLPELTTVGTPIHVAVKKSALSNSIVRALLRELHVKT